jgi:dTDP-4-dehydrorhamnose reductase
VRHGERWHAADLTVPADLDAVLDRVAPERVVLCAYVQHGPLLQPLTAEAPGWIAAACAPARFVHLSSDVVFPGRPEPVDEDAPTGPVHAYGVAKLESERRVLEARPDALVVRTSLLWAACGTQARLAREAPFPFYRDEIRCPTHLDDLASALRDVSATDLAGVVHLAGAAPVDRATFARALAAHLGADPTRIRDAPQPEGRPRHLHLVSRRVPALPGWRARLP